MSLRADLIGLALREFPGAKIVAINRPLFCRHCDGALAADYARANDTGRPASELVSLLNMRRSYIVERVWRDWTNWGCQRCGREIPVQKKGARGNVPQKGEPYAKWTIAKPRAQAKGQEHGRRQSSHTQASVEVLKTGENIMQKNKNLGVNNNSYLDRAEKLEPDGGGALVKFTTPGDTIVARFIARDGVQTKMGAGTRLSVNVLESNIEGVEPGPASIFESGHISQILDREHLAPDEGFMLKLCAIDQKTRFKRFGFQRLPDISGDGSVSPRDTNSKSRVVENGVQPTAKTRW